MTRTYWAIGLTIAVVIVIAGSEVSPEITNGLLLLILAGMILSRWGQIAPWVGLAGQVAGGEGPGEGKHRPGGRLDV